MKRTGISKKSGKQYTYYCCDRLSSADESARCDFMTWDVPVKDDCPVCGQTMFKKSGRGFKRPFCINSACENFLPEEKRGYPKKKDEGEEKAAEKKTAKKPAAKKAAEKKPAAKKTAEKKTAAKKPAAKKAAGKKTAAKKTTTKKTKTDAEA